MLRACLFFSGFPIVSYVRSVFFFIVVVVISTGTSTARARYPCNTEQWSDGHVRAMSEAHFCFDSADISLFFIRPSMTEIEKAQRLKSESPRLLRKIVRAQVSYRSRSEAVTDDHGYGEKGPWSVFVQFCASQESAGSNAPPPISASSLGPCTRKLPLLHRGLLALKLLFFSASNCHCDGWSSL